jgi:meso-butanediol dehydrogenase/(S,S)-butanediol dehydrogenase/diacetyl reductase
MNLKNKVALITGAGSGIGFAIAKSLAHAGSHTILVSRRIDLLRQRAEELSRSTGTTSLALTMDLRSSQSIRQAVQEAGKTFLTVDILVNNSGVGSGALAVDLAEDEWDRVIETNLKGAFLLTQQVLPGMIRQKSGHIINISSQAGKHGYANATVYCASKFGLIGFGQALQEEVRAYNIKVTNLLPALVQVPPPSNDGDVRHDVLQVEDLAETVLYVLHQPDRVKVEDIGLYHS